jgi:hypothetical protein
MPGAFRGDPDGGTPQFESPDAAEALSGSSIVCSEAVA